ncbi:MAG: bile acid:sodium symporter family protein [Jiangellaceae bacterium]
MPPPLLVWALVELLSIPDEYAIGLLLVGFASAGPLGIKAAQIAGADVACAVSLVVVLEAANALVIPLWVGLLMPSGVDVPLGVLLGTLTVLVLLPLTVGMMVRWRSPGSARRWAPRVVIVSNMSLMVVIALVVGQNVSTLADAFAAGIVPMIVVTVGFALVLGWLAGGPGRPTRAAVALVTGVRANAVALGRYPRSASPSWHSASSRHSCHWLWHWPSAGCSPSDHEASLAIGELGRAAVSPHRVMSHPVPSHTFEPNQRRAARRPSRPHNRHRRRRSGAAPDSEPGRDGWASTRTRRRSTRNQAVVRSA